MVRLAIEPGLHQPALFVTKVQRGTGTPDVLTKISHWPNKRLDDLLPHRYKALCQQAA
jgi:hypothetical protein